MRTLDSALKRLAPIFREKLGENLQGLYLHGSGALGCFSWETGDIDLVAVTEKSPTEEEKAALLAALTGFAEAPAKGIEMSLVLARHCRPFIYPTPYQLHWSERWRRHYMADPSCLLGTGEKTDRDLAAHFTVLRAAGRALIGPPPREMFAPVSRGRFLSALKADSRDYAGNHPRDPVYTTLNACRILLYLREGEIAGKARGGEWGLTHLPGTFRPLLSECLAAYRGEGEVTRTAEGGGLFALCEEELEAAMEREKVLMAFMPEGRVKAMPAKRKKRLVIYEEAAKLLTPGRSYAEGELNLLLAAFWEDYCTLRRALVDLGYMTRGGGIYRVKEKEEWPRPGDLAGKPRR